MRNAECGILLITARQRRAQCKSSCLRLTSSQIEEIENHPKNLRKSASSAVKKVLKRRFVLTSFYYWHEPFISAREAR
jgi:hypothetical protein